MKGTFIWTLTIQDKEKLSEICTEVIDLLRKKHELSPTKCAFVLDTLQKSLEDTMGQLFNTEVKEMKDWKEKVEGAEPF